MNTIFKKTAGLTDVQTHYCPGCTHGIVHRLVGEVLEELGVLDRTVGIASVGCSVMAYEYFNCDMVQAPHGRAPAVATGVKRTLGRDSVVFTYQGDGSCRHWHGGDRARCYPGRKHHRDFYQQCHLRHDGRADGPDDAGGAGHDDFSLRTSERPLRRAASDERDARDN